MINLDEFYRYELPRIQDEVITWIDNDYEKYIISCKLREAFKQAYKALKDERERCAKIAERYILDLSTAHTPKFAEVQNCAADAIAEEIRDSK